MRKGQAQKRKVQPDPIFNSRLVTRTINSVMYEGKKGLAQNIVYGAIKLVEEKTKQPGIEVYKKALENISPALELKARRVGGANLQVPTQVSPERKEALSLRWLISYARLRNEKTMLEKLAGEIIDASNETGGAYKKKEDTHRMAQANKAYANLNF